MAACASLLIVFAAPLALTTFARAAGEVTDVGALRRQITSGEIAGAVPAGSFITARYDDYGWVSWQVAALKDEPPATPVVVIVGGSAVRECLSDDAELARLVGEKSGAGVRVVTLATMMQRLPSTLAIIDNLPRGSGVVVIGVHHPTFAATQEDAENQLAGSPLLLTSAALRKVTVDEFGGDPQLNILPGLQTYLDTYERRRPRPPFTGMEMNYFRHRYDSKGALPLETKQKIVPRFSQGLGAPGAAFDTYFDYNVDLLRRCVVLARDKGYQVLLMQDPMDTAATGDAFASYEARYMPEIQKIVKAQGAHYSDLNASAGLVDGDFFDLYHLLSTGRAKWTPALAGAVATIFDDHPPDDEARPSPHDSGSQNQLVAAAGAAAKASPSPTKSAKKGDKAGAKGDKKKAEKNAEDEGGWPWWQTILALAVVFVVFLAVMRRRAVVRRRRRARARARRRGLSDSGVTAPAPVTFGSVPASDTGVTAVTAVSRGVTGLDDGAEISEPEPWWADAARRRTKRDGSVDRSREGRTPAAPPPATPPRPAGSRPADDVHDAETGSWSVFGLDD